MDISFRDYYLYNGETKKSSEFNAEFMNKGKSLYEVIRVIDGLPIFLERHMERLFLSSKLVDLTVPYNISEIKSKIHELLAVNKCNIGNIKIVFNFYKGECNFYAYFLKHSYPSKEEYENGVKTILFHGERDNPNAKVVNLSFREAVDLKIKESGAYEAILIDRDGKVTEGSKSNIFMIKGKEVFTAPISKVLPGITREFIIKAAVKRGYKVTEIEYNYKDIKNLDGMFISGTSPKVLPIRSVDEIELLSNQNQVVKDIMTGYDEEISLYMSIGNR